MKNYFKAISLRQAVLAMSALFFAAIFLFRGKQQTLVAAPEKNTNHWATMIDTSLSGPVRLTAHHEMKSLPGSWDSSLVLLEQLGTDKRDFVLEAMFRQQRSEQFLIQNNGLVGASTAGADLRWLIDHQEEYKLEELFLDARLDLLSHYLTQGALDSALAYIERTKGEWANASEGPRFEFYRSVVDVYTVEGDFFTALFYLKTSVRDAIKRKNKGELCLLYGKMGDIMYTLGFMEQAVFAYSLSLAAHQDASINEIEEPLVYNIARQVVTAVSEASARKYYHKGLAYIGDETEQYMKISLHRALAMFYVVNLQPGCALDAINEGIACAHANQLPVDVLTFRTEQVKLLNEVKDYAGSIKLALEIRGSLADQNMRSNLMTVYKEISYAYNQLGQMDSANRYFWLADSLGKEVGVNDQLIIDVVTLINGYEKETQQLVYEQEAQVYQGKLRRQKLLLYVVITLLLLAILTIYFAFLAYRFKRKSAALLTARSQDLTITNKRLNQFTSVVSHDILSRIDLLLSTGNMVFEDKPSVDGLNKFFIISHRTSLQLKDYCLNLLREARSGGSQSITSAGTVEQVINETIEMYAVELKQLNFFVIRGKMTAAAIPPVVIQQLIHNTVSNALKYVPVEGITPMLRITSRSLANGHFYWVIEDNGPGMHQKELKKMTTTGFLFRDGTGRGVGLSIMQSQLLIYGAHLTLHKSVLGGLKVVVKYSDKTIQGGFNAN